MTMASIPAESSGSSPLLLLNTRIKCLEGEHKQLEQSLRERVESLSMQINLGANFAPSAQTGLSTALVESIKQQHAELHRRCSEQLLRRQVQMQEEAEMREIIKNYQKRIMDLRSMLVGKQAEIVYDTYEIRRESIPKRENMQALNNEIAERTAIRKALEDLKKVRVEIDALQHAVKLKSAIYTKKNIIPPETSFLSCSNTEEAKGFPESLNVQALKKKSSHSQRDKLLAKVHELFLEEIAREERLKVAWNEAKSDWQTVSNQHQQMCTRYKTVLQERMNANKPASTQNLLLQLENEQEYDANAKKGDLFNSKDLNVPVLDSAKHSRSRKNLKEKRKQRAKEN